jgi:hypothetical protein
MRRENTAATPPRWRTHAEPSQRLNATLAIAEEAMETRINEKLGMYPRSSGHQAGAQVRRDGDG